MSEDFFGDLGKSISRATQSAVGRTSTFFESTKISAMISSEQKEIDKMYQAVGETVVNNAGDTGIVELDETIMDLISEIRVCQGRIHELKKELAGVRGMKVCPACHELVPSEVAFCPQCGEAMPVEEENASIAAGAAEETFLTETSEEERGILPLMPEEDTLDELFARELAEDIDIDAEVAKLGEMRFTTLDDVERTSEETAKEELLKDAAAEETAEDGTLEVGQGAASAQSLLNDVPAEAEKAELSGTEELSDFSLFEADHERIEPADGAVSEKSEKDAADL